MYSIFRVIYLVPNVSALHPDIKYKDKKLPATGYRGNFDCPQVNELVHLCQCGFPRP